MATEKKPYDQLMDVRSRVQWWNLSTVPRDFMNARRWLERAAKRAGQKLNLNDSDATPERRYRIWNGFFTAMEDTAGYRMLKAEGKLPKKTPRPRKKKQEPKGLYEQYPWIAPPNGPQE